MKAIRNILRVTLAAVTMTALMMAVLIAEARAGVPNQAHEKPTCSLVGEGVATAGWVKHRIFIGEKPVYGANDMSSVIAELRELRQAGRCL